MAKKLNVMHVLRREDLPPHIKVGWGILLQSREDLFCDETRAAIDALLFFANREAMKPYLSLLPYDKSIMDFLFMDCVR